jgi:hypothetical protein
MHPRELLGADAQPFHDGWNGDGEAHEQHRQHANDQRYLAARQQPEHRSGGGKSARK